MCTIPWLREGLVIMCSLLELWTLSCGIGFWGDYAGLKGLSCEESHDQENG